jgi:hypothetical protein
MFKKFIFLAITALFTNVLSAQTDAQLEKMAKYTCECSESSQKLNPGMGKNQLQMQLGLCMMKAAKEANYKITMTDSEAMKGMGEKLGMRMAFVCPDVIMALSEEFSGDKGKETTPKEMPKATASTERMDGDVQISTLVGRVTNVAEGDFVTITVVDEKKREHKLIWFERFDGDGEFIQNPQKLKDTTWKFSYKIAERFVPKIKENSFSLIITEITKK